MASSSTSHFPEHIKHSNASMIDSSPTAQPDFDLKQEEEGYEAWFQSLHICRECQRILDHLNNHDLFNHPSRPQHHHHSLASLEQSSVVCPICALFIRDWREHHAGEYTDVDREVRSRSTFDWNVLFPYIELKLVFESKPNPLDLDDMNLELVVNLMRSNQNDQCQVGRISRYTDCEQSWALARTWLRNCIASHEFCSESLMDRRLPTRLIYVGDVDSNPKLVITEGLPLHTLYLTLSHCWGSKPFMRLTKDSLEHHLETILMEDLSKTFREAVTATRKLGYEYIWIDSWCIIQDDEEDWKLESALMGSIYANSDMNLAAADSPDGDTGLFFHRTGKKVLGWKFPVIAPGASLDVEFWDCWPRFWRQDLFTNVVNSRAWVYQERFLSCRTLSFGADEISWECRAHILSETFPHSVEHDLTTVPRIAQVALGKSSDLPRHSALNNTNMWNNVVRAYSSRKLTFASDKLVAVSGIARLFAERFGLRYIAGMWDGDLPRQLTWRSTSPGPKVNHGRAPSWSWAYTDNECLIPLAVLRSHCRLYVNVEEISVEPSEDPFTVYQGGYVRLRCQTLPRGTIVPIDDIPGVSFQMKLYGLRLRGSGVWPDFVEGDLESQEVFYLPVLVADEADEMDLMGIVLRKIDDECYARVGSFLVAGKESIDLLNSVLDANKDDQEANFREGLFEKSWNGPAFIIKII